MEQQSSSSEFSFFKERLESLNELAKMIGKFLLFCDDHDFICEEPETRTTICQMRVLIYELHDKNEKLDAYLKNSNDFALFEACFGIINRRWTDIVDYINESKAEFILFLEDPIQNFARLKYQALILRKLNSILKRVLNCDELSDILDIKYRKFEMHLFLTDSIISENLNHFQFYAKWFDLNDENFIDAFETIMKPVKNVFINGKFSRPNRIEEYSSIIGPSFMGKSQLSFVIARIAPVFYFTFSENQRPQPYYENFYRLKLELNSILKIDYNELNDTRVKIVDNLNPVAVTVANHYESEFIFLHPDVKLFTIGFIWSLIEDSLEFDFADASVNWFDHYVKSRSKFYTAKSLSDFYSLMGNFIQFKFTH